MKINTLLHNNANFPKQLCNIHNPPNKLFYRGREIPPDITLLSIVGTRKPTLYGEQVLRGIIGSLQEYNIGIVSGLAIGTDALAHRLALEYGLYTIAVLPSGLDAIYPANNRTLAQRIIDTGGTLLSEYQPLFRPYKYTFLERNRIIAGLSSVTFISEATLPSGSLTTAQHALELGKDIAATPGPIFAPQSKGTNHLLQSGAHLITSGEDIISLLGITKNHKKVQPNSIHTHILDCIQQGNTSMHEIHMYTQLPMKDLVTQLTNLEITGHIYKSPDGDYLRR